MLNLKSFKELALPTEDELMAGWKGSAKNPLVSIICTTFNQVGYIEDALRGILIQKTNFPFELIVHDDASSDGTREILLSYKKNYPRVIKLILQVENQWSINFHKPFLNCTNASCGDFIAICEGDDFWMDDNKLQKQYEVLKYNSSIAFTFSPSWLMVNESLLVNPFCFYGPSCRTFTAQDILNISGAFAPTATYFFRKKIVEDLPVWFSESPVGDFLLELWSTRYGDIHYFPDILSVYRVMSEGSWSKGNLVDALKKTISFQEGINSIYMKLRLIDGFENIDTSIKESAVYLSLSYQFLISGSFAEFKQAITSSKNLCPELSLSQRYAYFFRDYPRFLLYVNFMRSLIKKIFFRK